MELRRPGHDQGPENNPEQQVQVVQAPNMNGRVYMGGNLHEESKEVLVDTR